MAAGKLQASTFTYPPPSREAKVLHESRNTPHSSKVSSYSGRAGSALHAVASSPNTISPTLAAAGIPYVEEAGKLDKKAVCRVGRGPERAVLPRLPPRENRWVRRRGRGCPMRSPMQCCMLHVTLCPGPSRWRRRSRCDHQGANGQTCV